MTGALIRFAALLVAAMAAAGCNNSPTQPPLFTTDTFSGAIGAKASASHTFITAHSSPTVIRVVSFAPAIRMGLSLGQPIATTAGEICQVTVGQATVQEGDTFEVPLDAATYCVSVFDIGNVVAPSTVAYSITVQHR